MIAGTGRASEREAGRAAPGASAHNPDSATPTSAIDPNPPARPVAAGKFVSPPAIRLRKAAILSRGTAPARKAATIGFSHMLYPMFFETVLIMSEAA